MTDYSKLKQLRAETGVSFSLCKKALEESKDNLDKAKELLREWGASKAADKADRSTSEGGIFSYVHHNKKIASLIEVQCETDFVSGNEEFKVLGQELAMQLASVPSKNQDEFLKQGYIRDPAKKINDLIKEAVLKFGENVKIGRMLRWELGKT